MTVQKNAFPVDNKLADGLWNGAFIMLACLPFGMALVHRSGTLLVVITAVLALAATIAEGRLGVLLNNMKSKLLSAPGILTLALLLWMLISLSWTYSLRMALFFYGELILSATAGFVLAMALPEKMPRWLAPVAAIIAIIAAVFIFADITSGMYFRQLVGAKAYSFIYNRSVLTLFLVVTPLLFLLWRRGEKSYQVLGSLTALITVGTIFNSSSGAAVMAVLLFIPVYVFARFLPKASLWIAAGCFTFLFAVAPFYGSMFYEVLPQKIVEVFESDHSMERVDLWRAFEYTIAQQPIIGGGFAVSPVIINTPEAAAVPVELHGDLNMGHPHNAAMQVWVELGLVGAILALTVLFAMLRALAALPSRLVAEQLAWIAGITFVAIIGHGAWQGWWLAAIGAGMAWFRAERNEAEGG
ncbi:O-antigen ligase family protein [Microvirga sp. W0021]|uniref:O-antigen ligase family protein n=1 Tax=Hohaiivirga grylli TaxID=3133970 RepID=A0ABV0BKY8_9HYPH